MESIIYTDKKLKLKDGINLSARLWFPKKNIHLPTLLMRQPYGKEIASTVTYPHPTWLAKQGYLVIIQDVRGKGSSEGIFSGFDQEISDTNETIKWIKTLPESNGRIGTYGFSYQGLTQLSNGDEECLPECIAPAMTGLDEQSHWGCEGGAFRWHSNISWGLQLAAQKAQREGNINAWNEIRSAIELGTYLTQGIDLLEKYDKDGMVLNWLKLSEMDEPSWKIHRPLKKWLKKPMLLIGGWWDPHLNGILDLYKQSIEAGGSPELHIGPASHLNWWKESYKLHVEFFNKHLKENNHLTTEKTQPILWNISQKNWEPYFKNIFLKDQWALSSEGLACIDEEEGELVEPFNGNGSLVIVHDPWRPSQAVGGHLGANPGLIDRRRIDESKDIAKFTSKTFERSLKISGSPKLDLLVKCDRETFDIFVAFSVIEENSEETIQISTGITRTKNEFTEKYHQVSIFLQPLLIDILQGQKIRLSIAGSAWPAFGVNPGTKSIPAGPPNSKCLITSIYLDLASSKFKIIPFF